jgi:hypothetical protein
MKIYRDRDGRIIGTERTVNEQPKSTLVDIAVKLLLIGSLLGLSYVIKLLI